MAHRFFSEDGWVFASVEPAEKGDVSSDGDARVAGVAAPSPPLLVVGVVDACGDEDPAWRHVIPLGGR